MTKNYSFYSAATSFLLFLILALTANAQSPGSLDRTFGNQGIFIHTFTETGTAYAVAVQPDRRIVAVGNARLSSSFDLTNIVMRFTDTGALDTSFNAVGYNTVAGFNDLSAVAVQADGKIVVAGRNTNFQFSVARFNADGSLDANFGTGGYAVTPVGVNGNTNLASLHLLADGKILLTGSSAPSVSTVYDFVMVKYNADGSQDNSFGIGGKVVSEIGSSSDRANDSVILADGKIIIVGSIRDDLTGTFRAVIVRYNPDGSVDTNFGSGGKIFKNNSGFTRIFVRPDGKLTIIDAEINIYSANGTLEASASLSPISNIYASVMQTDGKLLVSGRTLTNIRIISRFNADGSADTAFGNNGNIFPNYFPYELAIAPDGKIVAAGTTSINSNGFDVRIVLGRYLSRATHLVSPMDFDADSKADIGLYRASNGGWYVLKSSDNSFFGTTFGQNEDKPAPADFDGDGRTDVSVFRQGNWYRLNSSNNSFSAVSFGIAEDLPIPADYDGDGKADISVYRPSTGNWYRLNSSNNSFTGIAFGTAEDKPTIGDFDGDGKADIAVFRPSTGSWYRLNSSNGTFTGVSFGLSTDKIVPADYDGDGKADIAVFRDGNWYRLNSLNNQFVAVNFGIASDLAVPADYDGDGKADVAVFRNGNWYILQSTNGFFAQAFGQTGDQPILNTFFR